MADMSDWKRNVQKIVGTIDFCIQNGDDEALTLTALSSQFGYSDFYTSRKFSEISGMTLKDYIRGRRLSFALKEIRDTDFLQTKRLQERSRIFTEQRLANIGQILNLLFCAP